MFELDGKAIRGLLLEKQMTLRDLARAATITETTAARLSRDGARANARTAGKLAVAFGVNAEQILKRDEPRDQRAQ